jgi:hypothetical protein
VLSINYFARALPSTSKKKSVNGTHHVLVLVVFPPSPPYSTPILVVLVVCKWLTALPVSTRRLPQCALQAVQLQVQIARRRSHCTCDSRFLQLTVPCTTRLPAEVWRKSDCTDCTAVVGLALVNVLVRPLVYYQYVKPAHGGPCYTPHRR